MILDNFRKALDKGEFFRYNDSCFGRLAQLVEHALDVRRVSGSSPLSSTKTKTIHPDGFFLYRLEWVWDINCLRQTETGGWKNE